MSRTLTVEVSDEAYRAIEHRAEGAGASVASWLGGTLEKQFGALAGWRPAGSELSADELQAARERFERHFGAVHVVAAVGADNELIDADLAREYADNHEAS